MWCDDIEFFCSVTKKLLRSVSKTFFCSTDNKFSVWESWHFISDQQQTTRANKISDDVMIVIIITSNRQICGLFVPIHVRSSCCVRWCRRVEDVNNISQQTKHRPYDNWESAAYLKYWNFPCSMANYPCILWAVKSKIPCKCFPMKLAWIIPVRSCLTLSRDIHLIFVLIRQLPSSCLKFSWTSSLHLHLI